VHATNRYVFSDGHSALVTQIVQREGLEFAAVLLDATALKRRRSDHEAPRTFAIMKRQNKRNPRGSPWPAQA